jgi:hypothetical protein
LAVPVRYSRSFVEFFRSLFGRESVYLKKFEGYGDGVREPAAGVVSVAGELLELGVVGARER